ncbi:prepilin-type N-terminal cleavage/methylation domain-containing protein [Vibrio kyushuensis]|uniref:type II secretion system protein n=1 Tax=Vibrio kyushuensis TaxID=2910249 RepID=UPI003D11EE51
MKHSQGFTLIEMIVTILIAAILAITATPYFIDLAKDARISALKGAQAAIISSDCLVYGKSAMADTHKMPTSEVVIEEINGEVIESVTAIYGHFINNKENLRKVANLDGYSIHDIKSGTFDDDKDSSTIITLTPKGEDDSFDIDGLNKCYLVVKQASKNGRLEFDLIDTEC